MQQKPEKTQAIERIVSLQNEIRGLRSEVDNSAPAFKRWRRNVEVAITNIFGSNTRHQDDFKTIRYGLSIVTSNTPADAWHRVYLDGLASAEAILQSMVDEISEYWTDDPAEHQDTAKGPSATPSKKVFLVHGHDHSLKNSVARLLEKLDLEPVILHEQPNSGKTIIEKFESHAEVSAAVVLMTPDDVGAPKADADNLIPRARQNVIFEFGFFIGRLGRGRVCGLLAGNVEVPSDYSGVIYIPIDDAGAWKFRLLTELKSAGLPIDANKAL